MMVLAQWTRRPDCLQFFGGFGVTDVDDQNIQKFPVGLGHARDGNRQTLGGHQNTGRARDRLAANNRADGGDRGTGLLQSIEDARHGEDRANAGDRDCWARAVQLLADMMASITPGAGSAFSMLRQNEPS